MVNSDIFQRVWGKVPEKKKNSIMADRRNIYNGKKFLQSIYEDACKYLNIKAVTDESATVKDIQKIRKPIKMTWKKVLTMPFSQDNIGLAIQLMTDEDKKELGEFDRDLKGFQKIKLYAIKKVKEDGR